MMDDEMICVESLANDILEAIEDDFLWSGLTACDCGGPVDCCTSLEHTNL